MKKGRGGRGAGKWALVTGATKGIGRRLADEAAADGFNIVVNARNKMELDETAHELSQRYGVRTIVCQATLSSREGVDACIQCVDRNHICLDLLINNAGVGLYGAFLDLPLERQSAMIELNIMALTRLTHVFLGRMRGRKQGAVLNVASAAAYQPGPLMAVYYATKAYVLHFTEALAVEYKNSGVRIAALCPGATRTNFQERSGYDPGAGIFKFGVLTPEKVARAGYRGLWKGKMVIAPAFFDLVVAQYHRFLPRRVNAEIVYRLQKGRAGRD
jgi:uncharacterized protein